MMAVSGESQYPGHRMHKQKIADTTKHVFHLCDNLIVETFIKLRNDFSLVCTSSLAYMRCCVSLTPTDSPCVVARGNFRDVTQRKQHT